MVKVQKTPFTIELSAAGGSPVLTPDLPEDPEDRLIKLNNSTEYHFLCEDCGREIYVVDDLVDASDFLYKIGYIEEVLE